MIFVSNSSSVNSGLASTFIQNVCVCLEFSALKLWRNVSFSLFVRSTLARLSVKSRSARCQRNSKSTIEKLLNDCKWFDFTMFCTSAVFVWFYFDVSSCELILCWKYRMYLRRAFDRESFYNAKWFFEYNEFRRYVMKNIALNKIPSKSNEKFWRETEDEDPTESKEKTCQKNTQSNQPVISMESTKKFKVKTHLYINELMFKYL